jgi:hypothetical protein
MLTLYDQFKVILNPPSSSMSFTEQFPEGSILMKRMFVDRSLFLATAFGLLVGRFAYQFLLSEWYPALATAAVYASTAYFYFAFDISLLGTQVKFKVVPMQTFSKDGIDISFLFSNA